MEVGRIVRATEVDIELNGEIVTSKVIANTVKYYYDTEGKITKKVITPKGGSAQTIYYETNDDNTVVKFSAGGRTVTSHSGTDSFGRKVFDELQLGTDFVSRQFVYHAGKVTPEHKTNAKVKSSATTQLVSQIILSDGRAISYDYDNEERIIKVDDTIDGTISYTYDALGQLETETKNGVTTKFKYDNYGNITAKGVVDETGEIAEATKISYAYGSNTWRDLLTSYNGQTITYDAQGNPLTYLGHTLEWEKGRQLKKFVKSDGTVIDYTYNANGIRTSKKVNGVLHTYTLDGTKILRETWDGNTLIPLYDNEDGVCGILYNNIPYYFIKNLQGDVIAIVDKDAQTVARYSYDAWGVCTIVSDMADGIANINPYRYRSYYYDAEIAKYYLQSRYYDPDTGRFVNGDDVAILEAVSGAIITNLFSYCHNCPSSSKDINGNCFAQLFARILIGFALGFAFQILCDYIEYWYKRYIKNDKKAKPVHRGGDVFSSALTWALICVVPSSKVLSAIVIFLPIVVRHVWRACTGRFNVNDLLYDLVAGLIAFIISCCLGKVEKNKLSKITQKFRGHKNASEKIAKASMNLSKKFKVAGIKVNLTFAIAPSLIKLIFDALFLK